MIGPLESQNQFGASASAPTLPLGVIPDARDGSSIVPFAGPNGDLKTQIVAALWEVADRHSWIISATLTGSFLIGDVLQGISDIDLVVIVDQLNADRFCRLKKDFEAALKPVVGPVGFSLRINPTLGPLKFNDEGTAVLHLMLYSRSAHVEHAIQSPFTCFDWQRSMLVRKGSLADVYPVFGLQPHHFVNARRSVSDYLKDFRSGVVSFRELLCDTTSYREERREQPMNVRDRHEFAYHILRFLMQNLLKLVNRRSDAPDDEQLVGEFVRVFPLDCDDVQRLFTELAGKKRSRDFAWPAADLDRRLECFVKNFESQFRRIFILQATRHVVFRHARTELNADPSDEQRFVGRSNPEIAPVDSAALAPMAAALAPSEVAAGYCSPLLRCRQSYEMLRAHANLPEPTIDNRLMEIDYGRCEMQTVGIARQNFPELFAAWQQGEDAAFPGGERSADVARRAGGFVDDRWSAADGPTLTCTHNVVLRTLAGQGLAVPQRFWHRLQIPHLAPISFVQTRDFGWFIDLDESIERQIFADFASPATTT